MARVLVTGANGHVGANTVRSLLRHGHEVVPFVRATSDLRGLEPLDLTLAYGDVLDEKSLLAAAEGCDTIIHTAAVYKYWARNPDEIMQPAIAGTRNVFNVARDIGVRRVIYTSSVWAVGLGEDPRVRLTATDWNDVSHNPYAVAKTRAEREAWQLAENFGIPLISICPNGVFGRYDYRLTPSSQTLLDFINGTQQTVDAGFAFVDVRDVAEIHAQAVMDGEPGSRYIVSGENMTLREWGQLIGRLTRFTPSHVGLGRTPFWMMAGVLELTAKLTGTKPRFTRAFVHDTIDRYMFTDCSNTWETFSYRPHPPEAMLDDAIRWLLHLGVVKPQRAARLAPHFPPDPAWSTL